LIQLVLSDNAQAENLIAAHRDPAACDIVSQALTKARRCAQPHQLRGKDVSMRLAPASTPKIGGLRQRRFGKDVDPAIHLPPCMHEQ
jgi:hypothetical protein